MDVRQSDDGWVCEVVVDDPGQPSRHTVTVSPRDLERCGSSPDVAGVRDLVERSFAFLLEREPAGSILRRFDLAAIQHYFPDYDQRFKR